jgi:type IV pilus assembly protein PilQ
MRTTSGIFSAAILAAIVHLMAPAPAAAIDTPTRQVLIEPIIVEFGLGVNRASGDLGIDFRNVIFDDQKMSFSRTRGFVSLGVSALGPQIGSAANVVVGIQSQIYFNSQLFDVTFELPQLPNDQVRMIGRNAVSVFPHAGIEFPFGGSQFDARLRLLAGGAISDQKLTVELISNGSPERQTYNDLVISPSIAVEVAATRVFVPDGQTVLLGGPVNVGLKGSVQVTRVNNVPILGEIPLLGALITQHRNTEVSAQLQIFITPHIVGPN